MAEKGDFIKKRGSFKGRLTAFANYTNTLSEKPKTLSSLDAKELQLHMAHNTCNNKMQIKPKSTTTVSFQESLKVTLIVGQFFSLLPVFGITANNVLNVKYEKKSWKSLYAATSICCQIFMTLMCIYHVYITTSLATASSLVFYGTCWITMIIFINIAKSWPKLVKYIAKTEELDPCFDKKIVNMCNGTCAVVLCLALLEHILSLLSEIYGTNACRSPPIDTYEEFLRHAYGWIFILVPYHPLLGVLFQLVQIQATFTWNFSDLFLICMSYYLTSRLQLVNQKLEAARGKEYIENQRCSDFLQLTELSVLPFAKRFNPLPESFWRSTREKYSRATQLVRKVDKVISGIVFVSFANNLFYICLQLFYTLENGVRGENKCKNHPDSSPMASYITGAYFSYSLIYLISRSVALSLIASQVHTASTMPASVLYDVPTPAYCNEVQRFLSQVNGDKVALSGLQFFSVTRGLLLTVAGTIVTYELVMFQINVPSSTAGQAQDSSINTTAIPHFLNLTGS